MMMPAFARLVPAEELDELADSLGAPGRPWDNDEFGEPEDIASIAQLDAGEMLGRMWQGRLPCDDGPSPEQEYDNNVGGLHDGQEYDNNEDGEEYDHYEDEDEEWAAMRAPFSADFPGLAPAQEQGLGTKRMQEILGSLPPARIGLAAASRPADVLPLIGWEGAVNCFSSALPVAAVLRSWEDRFGARLLQIGFAEISLIAHRPPRTVEAARLLAAEQFAFCDECAGKGLHHIAAITEHLLESPIWTLWWD
jgi:hypothetical protein